MQAGETGPSRYIETSVVAIIIIAFLVVGVAFIAYTPAWQAPDEPAHFNYVKYIAEHGRLPELKSGDYPAEYLEQLKAARFPADMSTEDIAYESHQPPLYYVLAAAVYLVAVAIGFSPLLALRVFSLIIAALALIIGYGALRSILSPRRRFLALGALAFAAALPMHLAMSAAVNNDCLVELLLAVSAWAILRPMPVVERWRMGRVAALGLLLGLALLTKMQTYPAFILIVGALIWDALPRSGTDGLRIGDAFRRGVLVCSIALMVALPWLLRNVSVYGWHDPLALQRHNAVVAGQLTTAQYVAANGHRALYRAFVLTTFRSFWGQFGWMGVLLDQRVYGAFALLSFLAGGGLLIGAYHKLRSPEARRELPWRGLTLLALWLAATVAGYLWWNIRFVQHQGRYLFPALLPIALGASAGLSAAFRYPRTLYAGLGAAVLVTLGWGLARGDLPGMALAGIIASAGYLWIGQRLERHWPGIVVTPTFLALAPLALILLVTQIAPALRP